MPIPDCCKSCRHNTDSEFGDYGSRLGGPLCLLNVWMPTRTRFCHRHQGRPMSLRVPREGSADVPQPWIWRGLRWRYWYVHFLKTEYWRALERQHVVDPC